MATKSEIERIAVVEEKVDRMRDDLCSHIEKQDKFEARIETKLDTALEGKADKSEVDRLRKILFWSATAIITFLIWVLQEYLKGR